MTKPPASLASPPAGYADWLTELKHRIHTAQQRTALAVNRELVLQANRPGHLGAAGARGLGRKGDRPVGPEPAHRFPGYEGLLAR